MMIPEDKIVFGDLGLDALAYMKRVVYALDLRAKVPVAAAFTAGAPFEARIRMFSTGRHPEFTLVQIIDDQEVLLHTTVEDEGGAEG